ncbi:SdiA-regulated domain-containing protein [Solimonas terrae]|uniref:Nuclease n=1 Tax=Solimonas terrae TaxID=1396819 RepID=A0A6M2BRH4_9GAMM|nr:lamin tail domain-containing protein [Solimonas terrae]NGY04845.1 nuclease [Solimonas terrae]
MKIVASPALPALFLLTNIALLSACSNNNDNSGDTPPTTDDTPTLSFTSPQSSYELDNYHQTGSFALDVGSGDNLLAAEASGVTYNASTDTLFVIGDGGTSIVQVKKTGEIIDSMELSPGAFEDTEGISWVGGNQFVLVEERLRQIDQFTYVAGSTLDASKARTVKLGTTIGNIGLEGVSFDPMTSGYIFAKQMDPMGVFQSTVDFTAGTASNGSASTDESTNLFDPALLGLPSASINDVFALSNILTSSAPDYDNLLIDDASDGRIVKVDRAGHVQSTLAMSASAQNEGVTMDSDGKLYTVGEKAAGGDGHPGMTVFAPTTDKSAVGTGSNLYLSFAQDVSAGSGNITLSNGGNDVRTIPVTDAQVTISGKVVKINPTWDLAPGSTYSISYADGTFTGDSTVSAATLSFKTVGESDATPPTLTSASPVDDATNVGIDTSITLDFNETVRPGSGSILIESTDSDTRTIDVNDATQVTFSGSTVTIKPDAALLHSTGYDVRMTSGVITDTSGNAYAGITSSSSLNFTTVAAVVAAPTVLITEVNSKENSDDGADFFELYNYGSADVDISGWKWSDNHATATDSNNYEVFASGTVIPAGGTLVVTNGTASDDVATFKTAWGLDASTTVLSMGTHGIGLGKGDAVILFGADGKLVTALNYGDDIPDATQGDGSKVDVPTSPAAAGVTFASGSHAGTAFGGTDSGSAVWDGVSTSAPAYTAARVGDALGSYAAPGNAADIGSPGKAAAVAAAPTVLITEVNSKENSDGGADFFELYNYGSANVDISGWKWSDNHATATDASNYEVFPAGTVIAAGSRLIVTNGTASDDVASFKTAWGLDAGTTVLSMGTVGIGLGKADAVVLFGADGKLVTALNYGDAVDATQGDGSTVAVPTSPASTGVTFTSGSHAGTAFGGTDSTSAVWDGVSTTAPAYTAAKVGDALASYAAPGNAADIGSPGQ